MAHQHRRDVWAFGMESRQDVSLVNRKGQDSFHCPLHLSYILPMSWVYLVTANWFTLTTSLRLYLDPHRNRSVMVPALVPRFLVVYFNISIILARS
jgi:hypothetical protein